jgi:hypothetical protein
MDDHRMLKKILNEEIYGRKKRGRQRKRWITDVKEDFRRMRIRVWGVKTRLRQHWATIVREAKVPIGPEHQTAAAAADDDDGDGDDSRTFNKSQNFGNSFLPLSDEMINQPKQSHSVNLLMRITFKPWTGCHCYYMTNRLQ